MRKNTREVSPKLITPRNLGKIVQISNIASASATITPGNDATFIATSISLSGERLMDFGDVALYEGSLSAGNIIPNGSNITQGRYKVIGPWNDYQRTNGNNSKQAMYIRNNNVSSSFSGRVSQAIDDGFKDNTGWVNNTLNISLPYHSAVPLFNLISGFRITNVTIPNSATINTASLTFVAFDSHANGDVENILGIAQDNTADFSTDPTGRPTTAATVTWTPPAFTAGTAYTTPDISTIIQEIVNRAGWASGNAMGFLLTLNTDNSVLMSTVEAYDNSTTKACLLSVTYTAGLTKTVLIYSQGRAIINKEDLS